jgi:transcriptional regulator with XRE-family HTH domain
MILEPYSRIMIDTPSTVEHRLAGRIRSLRQARALTLDGLAERSGVSRSMISLIERGESSPTANILDRLAAGLGVSLASLFATEPRADATPLARRGTQPVWRDPETGYVRRNLSAPSWRSSIELVEVELPAGARVAYDTATRSPALDQQVWVLEGELRIVAGDAMHELAAGDCLAMTVDGPTAFHNPRRAPARYLVALAPAADPKESR